MYREFSMLQGYSINHLVAGFIAVLVGYTSSAAIIFQAAQSVGATPEQIGSWMFALGIGMGITSIALSVAYKMPLFIAWSTPGAALLVTSLMGVSLAEATGAFILSSVLILLSGITGLFERMMKHIPLGIGAAMLAGILLQFGLDVFRALNDDLVLVAVMGLTYLVFKRFRSRYTVVLVLLAGVLWAAGNNSLDFSQLTLEFATPVFTWPQFTATTLLSVGVPLFIVTMTSQNIPGVAVLKAHGYQPPVSPTITWTGLTSLILAPFGGYALNLAAITAAICMGPDVDKDPGKRYWASVSGGVIYLFLGVFGATVSALFLAFPKTLVVAIAGLALLATIANSLHTALADPGDREASLITFLIAASGVTLFGVGSAFWAIVIGIAAKWVMHREKG
nr:benzoate/H(+) symporter BenE family transporter [Hahella ganghwensis]